jgi:hypothetical protein
MALGNLLIIANASAAQIDMSCLPLKIAIIPLFFPFFRMFWPD